MLNFNQVALILTCFKPICTSFCTSLFILTATTINNNQGGYYDQV